MSQDNPHNPNILEAPIQARASITSFSPSGFFISHQRKRCIGRALPERYRYCSRGLIVCASVHNEVGWLL